MKYVQNDVFIPVDGKGPLLVRDTDHGAEEEHQATVGELLKMVLASYQPQQGRQLNTAAEIRSFNKCMDVIEKGPQDGDWYRFEDSDFKALVRVVEWVLPNMWGKDGRQLWRNTPEVLALLEKSPEAVPVKGA